MAVIRGSKDAKRQQLGNQARTQKVNVVYGSADPRQIRCPKCKNLVTNQPDGRGGLELRCGFCGKRFNLTNIT